MNIVMIKESLKIRAGGAERVFTTLANHLVLKNESVTLLTFDLEEGNSFYQLDSRLAWLRINRESRSPILRFLPGNFLKYFFKIRTEIKKISPEIVIVFGDFMNVFTILVCRSLNIPVIISDRNNPRNKKIKGRFAKMKRWVYPFASQMVVMTNAQKKCYDIKFQEKICVIPNPVLKADKEHSVYSDVLYQKPIVLSIGKLLPQKGMDLLIQSFQSILKKFPDWTLVILGEGKERQNLEELIIKLGLKNKVFLPGIVKNTKDYMNASDIFVLASRWEGFPNALGEAMAFGMPVIATDCDFGPNEMINHEKNGILVKNENVQEMRNALEQLMGNPGKRSKLGQSAKEISEKFHLTEITEKWNRLLSFNEQSNT